VVAAVVAVLVVVVMEADIKHLSNFLIPLFFPPQFLDLELQLALPLQLLQSAPF
jgi:hypothetical protein